MPDTLVVRLRIAELGREKKQMNIKQLAEDLFYEYQTVLYWNQGRAFPSLHDIVRLSKYFNCSVDELIEKI